MTAELLERLDRLREIGAEQVRISDALDLWADLSEAVGLNGRDPVSRQTARAYRGIVRNKLRPIVGDTMLGDVDTRYVAWLRNELIERFARAAAKTALRRFRGCLTECRVLGLIDQNPADDMTIRLTGRREPAIMIPSSDDALALLVAADRLASSRDTRTRRTWMRYRPIMYLLRFSGMRIGEVLGLPWNSINERECCISIVQAVGGDRRIQAPKTDSAFRTIYVPRLVIDLLSDWRLHCPASPDRLVFPGRRGRPMSHRDFAGGPWALLSAEAGLIGADGRPLFRRHDFRHRLASELIDLGASLKEVQIHMGHATPEVTMRHYGHLLSDRDSLERRKRRIRQIGEWNWPQPEKSV